ncbi:MAG: hypothetical protein QS721_14190 [Candidatus Endonucleobacter sp. (ex Gigantidas childressi)]|nr:hypothetical protein [Candidatus Endonucleobacter sp. (ex Gigantidas childressi)]
MKNNHVIMAKIGAIMLVMLFSFANLNPAFAGLGIGKEKIFKKNNVKIILTGACIFETNTAMDPADTSYAVSTDLRPLVYAQHQDKNDVAIIITPFFRDIIPAKDSYSEMPVSAMRQLFSQNSFDLHDQTKWAKYPESSEDSVSSRSMNSTVFYVSNTYKNSRFSLYFDCAMTYMGFSNILSDTIDVKKLDDGIVDENNDEDYITKGAAYLNVQKGLSEITRTRAESTTMCHVVLPVFHAWGSESKIKKLAVTAFCNSFLHDIERHLTIPSVIYVSLWGHSDQDVKEIRDFLRDDSFEIVAR